jgi:hypothetical protein
MQSNGTKKDTFSDIRAALAREKA